MRRIPHRARRLVGERSRSQCERCGQRKNLEMSHRIPRGMGGSTERQDNPALYCHLCHECHAWVEKNFAEALNTGYKVQRGDEPDTIPVQLWYGWHYIDDDGSAMAVIP